MLKRLAVVVSVLAVAFLLQFLQNKVLVGEQELQADLRPAATAPAGEAADRVFELVLKDAAGNPTEALPVEAAEVQRRLAGDERHKPITISSVSHDPVTHVIKIVAPAGIDELALRQRLTGRPYRRDNEAKEFWHLNLGIDLRGGVEFTCRLKNDVGDVVSADEEVVTTLRGRLDERGLTEPVVARLSNGDVQIVIPGGTKADAARTRKVLETTGRLEFREVIADYPSAEFPSTVAGEPTCAWIRLPNGQYRFNPLVPVGTRQDVIAPKEPEPGLEPTSFLHLGPPRLSGKDVADAGETMHQGEPAVSITFTAIGAGKNAVFTQEVKDRGDRSAGSGRLAITFDGVVKSDPRVISPSSKDCVISGRFTSDEISDLRGVLRAGSLQVTPEILSERVVGATLGQQEVERALTTMFWCVAAIIAFLAWYYRRLGVVALASMVICALMTWTTLSVFGATMTLPGIAGLILSIAMSIDTNVLIYERIREEMKEDKGLPAAIEAGYNRAFLTILDSNLTTMATGLVLYIIGTGPVKGFGLTLIIGIAISMFSGIYVGRLITDWLTRGRQQVSMSTFFKPMPFGYVRMRWVSYILTIVTAVAGVGYFAFGHKLHPGQGFDRNFDIEFTGGTMVQVAFDKPLTKAEVDAALAGVTGAAAELVRPGEVQAQPYFPTLAQAGDASRQWVFRVRDVEGAGLERRKAELEAERGEVVRELERLRSAVPPDLAGSKRLENERFNPLSKQIQAVSEAIAGRTEAFKQALGTAFTGHVSPEGTEVLAAAFADNRLTLKVATLDPPTSLQAGEIARRLEFLGREVTVTTDGSALELSVRYADRPRPQAGAIEAIDAVSLRCSALFAAGGIAEAEARELGAVAGPVVESLVEAAAGQRVVVAQPYPASQHFSGQVADRMKWQALIAVVLALVAMLLYIAARFELAYGFGAAVSLLHVVIQTVGLIVLLGVRIDLTVVAAVLTVIGYAINDTIVVYDRIREYVGKMAGRPLGEIIDTAIADTMPRTFLTGGMVMASLVFMLMFAGDSLEGFCTTLLVGILLGTYSSVFVASPLLLSFRRQVEAAAAQPPAEQGKPAG
jgi:SecD/SecF fusion protein